MPFTQDVHRGDNLISTRIYNNPILSQLRRSVLVWKNYNLILFIIIVYRKSENEGHTMTEY